MACGTTHEFNKVVVFFGGVAVTLDVADNFGVYLRGSIEAERGFNPFILKVAVDGLGAADYLHTRIDALVVLGENGSVGVIAADDYEGSDAEFFENFKTRVELLHGFELCASGADDVEAARVAVLVDDGSGKFYVFMVYETAGAHEETIEVTVAMYFLDAVKKA